MLATCIKYLSGIVSSVYSPNFKKWCQYSRQNGLNPVSLCMLKVHVYNCVTVVWGAYIGFAKLFSILANKNHPVHVPVHVPEKPLRRTLSSVSPVI